MSITEIARVVKDWLWLIFLVAALAGAATWYVLRQMQPVYTAATVVFFDERENRILTSDSAWSSLGEPNTISYINKVAPIVKQTEVLNSLPVWKRVVEELNLTEHPDVIQTEGDLAKAALSEWISALPIPSGSADAGDTSQETDPSGPDDAGAGYPALSVTNAFLSEEEAAAVKAAGALGEMIDVRFDELESLITIRVTSPDPVFAAAIANAIPSAYLAEHNDRITLASRSVESLLAERVAEMRKELAESRSPSPNTVSLEQIQRKADMALYQDLLSRLYEVQQLQDIQSRPVTVLSAAGVPSQPSGSSGADYALIVAIVVGMFGVFVVAARELASHAVGHPRHLPGIGLEILAAAPAISQSSLGELVDTRRTTPLSKPEKQFHEALRRVVAATGPGHKGGAVILLVTASTAGEGASSISFGLAKVAARAGLKALWVDADLGTDDGHPGVSDLEPGLQSALLGKSDWQSALLTDVSDTGAPLEILPANSSSGRGADLFASPAMGAMLGEMRERFDFVVIDTAPNSVSADAEVLASRVDGAILIVGHRQVSINRVRSTVDLLQRETDGLLGCFVTRATQTFLTDLYGPDASNTWWRRRRVAARTKSFRPAAQRKTSNIARLRNPKSTAHVR